MAYQLTPLAHRQTQQIDIIEAHAVGGHPPVVLGDAANRFSYKAFTRAGLPDEAAYFPLGESQADAIDGFYPAFAGLELNS